MTWLLSGVVLWSVLHFIPTLARGFRRSLIDRMGEKTYMAGFAIGVVISIILMVTGWLTAEQWDVYQAPAWGRPVNMVLVLVAFVLFGLAKAKTNVKRVLRHPQLTGMIAWAAGHLAGNGDNLALLQFGGLGLWAIVEIFLINRREGAWVKPEPVPFTAVIKPVLIGLVVFAVFLVAHPYLFGVSPFPPK